LIAGGLECAIFVDKAPHIECISFGPTVYDVHSSSERLNIKSSVKIFEILTGFLKFIK
jgi:dipeptidase D